MPVTINVDGIGGSEHVSLYIDGVEKMRWSAPSVTKLGKAAGLKHARLGEDISISQWLALGDNEVRVVVARDNKDNKSSGYDVTIMADQQVVLSESGPASDNSLAGIRADKTINISMPAGVGVIEKQALYISGPADSAIYINNTFTGKTIPSSGVANLSLNPGEYRIGLGELKDDASGNAVEY